MKLSDKVFHAYSLGRERNLDGLEITRIARGISEEQMDREPSLFTIINANSPLTMDEPMLQGIIEMSSRNQAVVLTPFTLAGAMAPITLAGGHHTAECRGIGRHRLHPGGQAGGPSRLRRFHVKCGYENRIPGLWDAGICQGRPDQRPVGAPVQNSLSGPPM